MRLCLLAAAILAVGLAMPQAWAQNWGEVANVSATMGVKGGRLCVGEASRGDLGCPTWAPSLTTAGDVSVTGNLSAGKFIGDGSGLTGVTAASADRIISGTAQMIANGNSNSISITEAGVTTGYYYNGVWVAGGVSTTGPVSSTGLYVTGNGAINGLLSVVTGTNIVGVGYNAATSNSGNYVTAFGAKTGQNNTGLGVTAVGYSTAQNNTADYLSAFGYSAAAANSGSGVSAFGYSAAAYNAGDFNTAVGHGALYYQTTGFYNVAVGANSGRGVSNSSAYSANTLIGYRTGLALTTGSSNTLIGYNTGATVTTGGYNLLLGYNIAPASVTGSYQMNLGNALYGNIGSGAGNKNLLGVNVSSPTANLEVSGTISGTTVTGRFVGDGSGLIGVAAGDRITSGTSSAIINPSGNVSVRGLLDIVSGTNVVGVGQYAAGSSSGSQVVALGSYAAQNNSASYVTALGTYAGRNNSGLNATFVGYNSGLNSSGTNVTALGFSAGQSNAGANSTFVGSAAGGNNTGTSVAAVGYQAGYSNSGNFFAGLGTYAGAFNSGDQLTAVGYGAGEFNAGTYNTAMGYSALLYQTGGNFNVAIGGQSGQGVSNTSSFSSNSMLGFRTGFSLTTGSNNTLLGYSTGYYLTTGSNNILIGYAVSPVAVTGSYQLNLGNALYGNLGSGASNKNLIGVNVLSPTASLEISGTVSATVLQLADGPAITCGPATYGTMKMVNGRPYYCRP